MTLIHTERTTPGKRPPELGGTCQEGDGLPGTGWRKRQGLVSWKQAGDHCFVRPQTTGSQTWFELSFEIQTISHTNLDSDFFHHKQSEDLVTWVPFSYEALMGQRAEGLQPLDGVQAQWTRPRWLVSPKEWVCRLFIKYLQAYAGTFLQRDISLLLCPTKAAKLKTPKCKWRIFPYV